MNLSYYSGINAQEYNCLYSRCLFHFRKISVFPRTEVDTILPSHQWCLNDVDSLHPYQYLVVLLFVIFAILIDIWWYLVFLICIKLLDHKDFLLCFHGNYVVLSFTFRSMNQFDLIFELCVRLRSRFFLFITIITVVCLLQYHLLKLIAFLHWIA